MKTEAIIHTAGTLISAREVGQTGWIYNNCCTALPLISSDPSLELE